MNNEKLNGTHTQTHSRIGGNRQLLYTSQTNTEPSRSRKITMKCVQFSFSRDRELMSNFLAYD